MEIWLIAEQSSHRTKFKVQVVGGGACTWGAEVQCILPVRLFIASIIKILGMIVYCLMFYVYIYRAIRQYKKELYQKYRLGNLLTRIQARAALPSGSYCAVQSVPLHCAYVAV